MSSEPYTAPRRPFYQPPSDQVPADVNAILVPHPSTPCEAVRSIAVTASRTTGGSLELIYAIEGDMSRIRLPPPVPPRRADGLWRHTCFEAFLAPDSGSSYVELNFSPSGEWACYAFTAYREGMIPAEDVLAPAIGRPADAGWSLRAAVTLASLRVGEPVRLALSAVIEGTDGAVSYWALRHPQGKPDFHHPAGFALRI